MRVIVYDIDSRSRPKLVTPAKGTEGDMTNESMAPLTDLNAIIKRYGGNLADLVAWRGPLTSGDDTIVPADLQDAIESLKAAHDTFDELPNNPFASFEDAMTAIKDGTFEQAFVKADKAEVTPEKEITTDEAKENQSQGE